jgi:hypothetical protein
LCFFPTDGEFLFVFIFAVVLRANPKPVFNLQSSVSHLHSVKRVSA